MDDLQGRERRSDTVFSQHYLFHGLNLTVASDHPAVLVLLHPRLRAQPAVTERKGWRVFRRRRFQNAHELRK